LQTTLLGLAIAIILALLAALVGPLLIDLGNYRSVFETEARRLTGANIRVAGPIDARLLPSPRLTLHDITVGDGNDVVRARSLDVEFALGSLMRGEWRATEMQLVGPQVALGLDDSGHVRAPSVAVSFRPDDLSINRLRIEDGTITLTNAGNDGSITLGRVSFNGEVRSLVGPLKGEGSVTLAGKRFPYRLTTNRLNDDGSMRLRVVVDAADYPLSIEADGALAFVAREPSFDGTLNLSRPVGIVERNAAEPADALTQPWRIGGKIKASGKSALMDNLEFQYGSEEQGFKLTGVADLKFGRNPRFQGVLSGRQIDVDRVISGSGGATQSPVAAMRKLTELGTAAFRTTLPVQLGLGIDLVTLGGNSIQNLRGDISSSAEGWNLERFEFRAPGMTQVRVSGRLAVNANDVAFTGPAEIESSDPKILAAWLESRSESQQNGDLRPMSLRGDLALSSEKIAVDRLSLEFNRQPLTGRFAYFLPSGNRPARVDAELTANQFDFDSALEFSKALLAGSVLDRPREISLKADIGRTTFAGIEANDAHALIKVDGDGLLIDRLSIGDFAGGSFAASGRIETGGHAPRGTVSVDFEAKQTAAIAAIATKLSTERSRPVLGLLERFGRGKLRAKLDMKGDDKSPVTDAQLALNGDLDDLRIDARVRASGDWARPSTANIRVDAALDAARSAQLLKFMNLDRMVAAGNGPGQLKIQLAGPVSGDMTFDAQLAGEGLSARANGTGRYSDMQGIKATAGLQINEADLKPLRSATGGPLPIRMKSRVSLAAGTMTFDDIDAKIAGSSVRGRLAVGDATPRRIDGAIEADVVDLPALVARAIGLQSQAAGKDGVWNWSDEPFGSGLVGAFTGGLALKVARADVLPQLPVRQFNAALRLANNELSLDDVTGDMAGGRLTGRILFRNADDGLTSQLKVSLSGANAATLFAWTPRPSVTGSLDLTAALTGTGLSPIALVGSLKGSGKIMLADAKLSGLDARVFDVVTRAVDQGLVVDNGRISDLAGKSLANGQFPLKHAELPFQIVSGQLGLVDISTESKGAGLSVTGMLDLTNGSLDTKLTLSGANDPGGSRPKIFVSLKGPVTVPSRNVDTSALSGWLTLRAVENQTKRLRSIENVPSQPQGRGLPKSKQAPALPAPIDIRPAPTPRSAGQPAASVRSQN
jgi:large subunit ribosomal protein L24